jgi:hypothetical protein
VVGVLDRRRLLGEVPVPSAWPWRFGVMGRTVRVQVSCDPGDVSVSPGLPGIALSVLTCWLGPLARGVHEVMGHPDIRPYVLEVTSAHWVASIGADRALITGPGLAVPTKRDVFDVDERVRAFEVDASCLSGLAGVLPPVRPVWPPV